MYDRSIVGKGIIGFLLVALILMGVWSFSLYQRQKNELLDQKETIHMYEEKQKKAEEEVAELTNQVEKLYVERNGTANEQLEIATKELFSMVYNYRTDREEDSVKERKNKARTLTSEKALNSLFPEDAETIVPSISTVSVLEGTPEIYLMPSNEKELTALIVVPYSVSIAGSEKQTGTFMYKAIFNPERNQFTQIENVGSVPIS
ncbi:hypothetical protein [Enterococcus sp. 5H]|uniref:hypothetical protein n=1 Tax=Enterococcus sp. 5H TaxID=1229490 RepID=UPI002304C351|nr:hypothetical protein [Enterococcus sp. 5H]MDA9469894.1 hypothetical protein [Enterococcus sp. 5H]